MDEEELDIGKTIDVIDCKIAAICFVLSKKKQKKIEELYNLLLDLKSLR